MEEESLDNPVQKQKPTAAPIHIPSSQLKIGKKGENLSNFALTPRSSVGSMVGSHSGLTEVVERANSIRQGLQQSRSIMGNVGNLSQLNDWMQSFQEKIESDLNGLKGKTSGHLSKLKEYMDQRLKELHSKMDQNMGEIQSTVSELALAIDQMHDKISEMHGDLRSTRGHGDDLSSDLGAVKDILVERLNSLEAQVHGGHMDGSGSVVVPAGKGMFQEIESMHREMEDMAAVFHATINQTNGIKKTNGELKQKIRTLQQKNHRLEDLISNQNTSFQTQIAELQRMADFGAAKAQQNAAALNEDMAQKLNLALRQGTQALNQLNRNASLDQKDHFQQTQKILELHHALKDLCQHEKVLHTGLKSLDSKVEALSSRMDCLEGHLSWALNELEYPLALGHQERAYLPLQLPPPPPQHVPFLLESASACSPGKIDVTIKNTIESPNEDTEGAQPVTMERHLRKLRSEKKKLKKKIHNQESDSSGSTLESRQSQNRVEWQNF